MQDERPSAKACSALIQEKTNKESDKRREDVFNVSDLASNPYDDKENSLFSKD